MLALNKTPDESDYEINDMTLKSKKDDDKPIENYRFISKEKN